MINLLEKLAEEDPIKAKEKLEQLLRMHSARIRKSTPPSGTKKP